MTYWSCGRCPASVKAEYEIEGHQVTKLIRIFLTLALLSCQAYLALATADRISEANKYEGAINSFRRVQATVFTYQTRPWFLDYLSIRTDSIAIAYKYENGGRKFVAACYSQTNCYVGKTAVKAIFDSEDFRNGIKLPSTVEVFVSDPRDGFAYLKLDSISEVDAFKTEVVVKTIVLMSLALVIQFYLLKPLHRGRTHHH